MGYSHYWHQEKAIVLTPVQIKLIEQVREDHKDILGINAFSSGTLIHINGIEDEAHEDFIVNFEDLLKFEFCKTARKPYDLPVCKLLLILALSPGFTFSTDGDYEGGEENWLDAQVWFRQKVQIPYEIGNE
jgi:hypothetical protein